MIVNGPLSLLLSAGLLPCIIGCAQSSTGSSPVVAVGSITPQVFLSFEKDSDNTWGSARIERAAHTGRFGLHVSSEESIVRLASEHVAQVGENVIGVRVSAWMKPDGLSQRMRLAVQLSGPSFTGNKAFGRIVRKGELPANAWTLVHFSATLPSPAPNDARMSVMLCNEGGGTYAIDGAVITFVSTDIPGREQGAPLDADSLMNASAPAP